jgi:hypothetical protein
MVMHSNTEDADLKVLWIFTQCSNGRDKLYSVYIDRSRHHGQSRSAANPLVVVAYAVHTTIQVLAFFDLFCCTVNSACKQGPLYEGKDYMLARGGKLTGMTHSGVRSHAHWGILAVRELQLVGKLQSKILINMVKSLQ